MANNNNDEKRTKDQYMGIGMAIGMLMFTPVGLVLAIVTGSFGLLGIGPGLGVGVGIAIGEKLHQRSLEKNQ